MLVAYTLLAASDFVYLIPLGISLGADIVMTSMIAGRLIHFNLRLKSLGISSSLKGPYATLMLVFVESGMISAIGKGVALYFQVGFPYNRPFAASLVLAACVR